jgi:hypothetical protein
MVTTENDIADQWISDHYNYYWFPTCYWDGGDWILVGGYTDTASYASRIGMAGQRPVPDLDLDISMTWLGNYQMEVTVTVTNNQFVNSAPDGPAAPSGPTAGLLEDEHTFSVSTIDPDGDDLYYMWDWAGETSDWMGPYASGASAELGHAWSIPGEYAVAVKAKDIRDAETAWSEVSNIKVVARGNANGDSLINVGDVVYLINYIFREGPPPEPVSAGDADCNGLTNIGDPVYLINYIWREGPPPGCL